jgi:hypothetical protein
MSFIVPKISNITNMAKLLIQSKYGQTPNELLNNPNISLKAKGLFGYLQSKPNEWNFSVSKMKKQLKEGKDAISVSLKELEQLGYLRRTPAKNSLGQWEGYDYLLAENPFPEKPSTGKPLTENPYTLSKKELSKKELSKKEINTLQTDVCEVFSSAEYFNTLSNSPQKHIQLIGWYFREKNLVFPSKKSAQAELLRWVRDARLLIEYPEKKIIETKNLVQEKFPFDWKLSTIVKYINETKSDEKILLECIEEAQAVLGLDGDWDARARMNYLAKKGIPFENHWLNPEWTKWLKKYPYLKTT